MSETKTIDSLKSDAGLEARVLHNGTYWAVVRATLLEGKDGTEAFGLFMSANGGTGRDAYIAVRDDLRACLRSAQQLQRALRAEELRLKAEGLGTRESVGARMTRVSGTENSSVSCLGSAPRGKSGPRGSAPRRSDLNAVRCSRTAFWRERHEKPD